MLSDERLRQLASEISAAPNASPLEAQDMARELLSLRCEITVADLKKRGVQGLCAVTTVRAVNEIVAARINAPPSEGKPSCSVCHEPLDSVEAVDNKCQRCAQSPA